MHPDALEALIPPARTELTPEQQAEADDLTNCPRAIAICHDCGEPWFRGTCGMPGHTYGLPPQEFCMHDDADRRFWRHINTSERHQAILTIRYAARDHALAVLPDIIQRARKHQKLLASPEAKRLKKLFAD